MQEIHSVKELVGSIEQLLPVPGLEVAIEYGRAVQWDLRVKATYQGLRFDLIIEIVPAESHNRPHLDFIPQFPRQRFNMSQKTT